MFDMLDLKKIDLKDENLMSYSGLEWKEFDCEKFECPQSEEFINIVRAPKEPSDNGLKFWIAAITTANKIKPIDLARYIFNEEFKVISEQDFYKMVTQLSIRLLQKLNIPFSEEKFNGAIAINGIEFTLEMGFFAEYQNEYIYFEWYTTS